MTSPSPGLSIPLHMKRWNKLRNVLERAGPFCKAVYSPSPEVLQFLQTTCKVLVLGKLLLQHTTATIVGWLHFFTYIDLKCIL